MAMPLTSSIIAAPAAAATSTPPKSSANSNKRLSYRLLSILGFLTVLVHSF